MEIVLSAKSTFLFAISFGLIAFACNPARKAGSNNISTEDGAAGLTNSKWKLVELYGQPVAEKINDKEPFLQFLTKDSRYSASGGCNTINGTFTLPGNNRIHFSQGMSTLMACENMDVESRLIKVLETADNSSLSENTLTLNKARMAPLARFQRVE